MSLGEEGAIKFTIDTAKRFLGKSIVVKRKQAVIA